MKISAYNPSALPSAGRHPPPPKREASALLKKLYLPSVMKRQTKRKGKMEEEKKKETALKTKTHPTAPPPPPLRRRKQKTSISFGVENPRPKCRENGEERAYAKAQNPGLLHSILGGVSQYRPVSSQ